MNSFIQVSSQSDFPIQNIPFGVAKIKNHAISLVSRIGDTVISLSKLYEYGYLKDLGIEAKIFENHFLNDFMELGKEKTNAVRERLQTVFEENSNFKNDSIAFENSLFTLNEVEMLLPIRVPNYTDFYSSLEHATNVGKLFRDPKNALLPNWKHLPVAYHGRASSIIVSGQDIIRPKGQMKPADVENPIFGPTKFLDFELETAFITCKSNALGTSISTDEAEEYIFGMVLFNDWSARDIQAWEYVPLGPFLGKNFASSMSPWVITLEALEPFRVASPKQDVPVLPYLEFSGDKSFDINLQVIIKTQDETENIVCTSNFDKMYWNMSQQLAHHTVNGCNIQIGDVYGSGTISGEEHNSFGSMLELTWRGTNPLKMKDGTERKAIEDGDTVILRGWCENKGLRIGFGEVETKVLPAIE